MNKLLIKIIAACIILGTLLIIASKISQNILFSVGIIGIIIGVLLMAFMLYNSYKK